MSTSYDPPDRPREPRDPVQPTTPAQPAQPVRRVRHDDTVQDTERDAGLDRDAVQARERARFGGVKIGSAFFGWLTATGVAAILTSLLAAAGAALGLANDTSADAVTNQAAAGTGTAQTVGLVGAIGLLVILFVAYYCGGYVAGRMARFDGTKQGLAVWLWAVVIAIVVAVLAAVAGAKYDVLARLNLPRIPVNEGTLTTTGITAIVLIAVVTLIGALLGGKAGMHFHRKVDDVGLRPDRPGGATI